MGSHLVNKFNSIRVFRDGTENIPSSDVEIPTRAVLFPPSFDITELFEIRPRSEDVDTISNAMGVIVIVATKDYINKASWNLVCQLVVIRFSLVGNCNDELCALRTQLRHKFNRRCGSRLVDQVRRKGINRG